MALVLLQMVVVAVVQAEAPEQVMVVILLLVLVANTVVAGVHLAVVVLKALLELYGKGLDSLSQDLSQVQILVTYKEDVWNFT
jgi:hypothetical protein